MFMCRVVNWVQCPDMISSARFTPDGQLTVAGLYDGRVIFHHTADLRYYTQVIIPARVFRVVGHNRYESLMGA